VRDEAGDGDAQADDGGVEGLGNAARDHAGVAGVDVREKTDEAGERAEQADERADAGRDLEDDEAALQPRGLVACLGLHGFGVVRSGPGEMTDEGEEDAAERRGMLTDEVGERPQFVARLEAPDFVADHGGHHARLAQGKAAPQHHRHREHGQAQQRHHENPALEEEIRDRLKGGGEENGHE